ncbi:SDR family NAD(P)-dependent oxidoreductase [Streptomyces sp. NPDC057137]|uniref:SDR family NAD(P)-dependent oxidoreductase n=1 Tax=Streptomyces sp. NPDC057137 TaxID=3346030 RepID=UPI003633A00C
MEPIRFDGRVAIVTGAGRGIGKAHALLLAERGARVVVNDLGSASSGEGSDRGPAEHVVATIRAAGGEAVADASDIASAEGAAHLVRRALDAYGRVDILVNNAGIFTPGEFPDLEVSEMRRYFDVHVGGSFNVTRECWPHMVRSGYGRIVMTTSHGILGSAPLIAYGTAKGGVFALARALAVTGRGLGITVNSIAPVAATRLAGGDDDGTSGEGVLAGSTSALVSPLVTLLCHESCPVSGETFVSGGRRHARLFVGETEGYVHPDAGVTPEAVAEHWAQIMDAADHYIPEDTDAWMKGNAERIASTPPTSPQ